MEVTVATSSPLTVTSFSPNFLSASIFNGINNIISNDIIIVIIIVIVITIVIIIIAVIVDLQLPQPADALYQTP